VTDVIATPCIAVIARHVAFTGGRTALTVMLQLVVVLVAPFESVTLMVKLKTPVAVGVPVMAPFVVFNVKPVGSAPDASANVYPGVPPLATTLEE